MAIRPAEALLGLSGELDREAGLRPRSPMAALEPHNPGRPEAARSDVRDTLAGSKLDAPVCLEASEPHNLGLQDQYRVIRYRLANLLPSIPPIGLRHSRMPVQPG